MSEALPTPERVLPTRPQFDAWLKAIFAYYNKSAPDAEVTEIYHAALKRYTLDELSAGRDAWIASQESDPTRPPKAHQILSSIRGGRRAPLRSPPPQELSRAQTREQRVRFFTGLILGGMGSIAQSMAKPEEADEMRFATWATNQWLHEQQGNEFGNSEACRFDVCARICNLAVEAWRSDDTRNDT